MPDLDVFQRAGFFLVPGYLSSELCARVRREMRAGAALPAEVVRGADPYVDRALRRTARATVSGATAARFGEYLEALRPWLERHFGTPLSAFEPVQYLLYRPGDFFARHIDGSNPYSEGAALPGSRKVSVVIYLNDGGRGTGEESFTGGRLTVVGVDGEGVALPAKAGLLAAFPSHIVHEVTPVTDGERFSAVTWFF